LKYMLSGKIVLNDSFIKKSDVSGFPENKCISISLFFISGVM